MTLPRDASSPRLVNSACDAGAVCAVGVAEATAVGGAEGDSFPLGGIEDEHAARLAQAAMAKIFFMLGRLLRFDAVRVQPWSGLSAGE